MKAPAGAPNVVWILIDDAGFGAAGTFGGLIQTLTFDSLASNGLRYTNFHTAALCAGTRAALLTGRNSASVHESGFSHISASAGFPGWDGRLPSTGGTIAEILRDNGYNTFAVGKYGVTPDEEATDAGPFDHWPTGKGFDHFFGFLGSATDQYKPDLVEDQAHVTPDGRHLSDQITDKAIFYNSGPATGKFHREKYGRRGFARASFGTCVNYGCILTWFVRGLAGGPYRIDSQYARES